MRRRKGEKRVKKKYEPAKIEAVIFQANDLIATSTPTGADDIGGGGNVDPSGWV
ncbi:MAG: hypothetical protein J6C09_08875 [Clostridia bacterium]|nr:hypothetical protein [Clostridia bacterium]